MNNTLYEVNWHFIDDAFSHCSVSPITVIRKGCTGNTIIAIDSKGDKFQGSPDNYYATESDAWLAVKAELLKSIELYEKRLVELQIQLSYQREYLGKLT